MKQTLDKNTARLKTSWETRTNIYLREPKKGSRGLRKAYDIESTILAGVPESQQISDGGQSAKAAALEATPDLEQTSACCPERRGEPIRPIGPDAAAPTIAKTSPETQHAAASEPPIRADGAARVEETGLPGIQVEQEPSDEPTVEVIAAKFRLAVAGNARAHGATAEFAEFVARHLFLMSEAERDSFVSSKPIHGSTIYKYQPVVRHFALLAVEDDEDKVRRQRNIVTRASMLIEVLLDESSLKRDYKGGPCAGSFLDWLGEPGAGIRKAQKIFNKKPEQIERREAKKKTKVDRAMETIRDATPESLLESANKLPVGGKRVWLVERIGEECFVHWSASDPRELDVIRLIMEQEPTQIWPTRVDLETAD